MVTNHWHWAPWTDNPHVSQAKLSFQISWQHFACYIRTWIFPNTDNSALFNLVKNKSNLSATFFLGVTFGNSRRWHGPPEVRSTGRMTFWSTVGEPPNATQSSPNWDALGMMGTDSQPPGGVWGQLLVPLLSTCPALVSSVFENLAELWCHCFGQAYLWGRCQALGWM